MKKVFPYDLQFRHNISMTDARWTTTMPIARPLLKYGWLTISCHCIQPSW